VKKQKCGEWRFSNTIEAPVDIVGCLNAQFVNTRNGYVCYTFHEQ
jgi:hypothetical protein